MIDNILIFIFSCIALVISAELLVKALTKIAFYLRLTEFAVGFMVVALATSIPELFIGITSALKGTPELSLGNVIGANIMDLTLIIGIVALIRKGITIETKTVRTDTLYMFVITLLPLILMLDMEISKFDGFILLAAFFLYAARILRQERRFKDIINNVPRKTFLISITIAVASLVTLLISANFVSQSATTLAAQFMLPPIIIGLFIISIGTTLPELTFETTAVLSKHRYMAFGDLLGSVVANSTLVLGVTAIIHPISANFLLFITSATFMVVFSFLFMTFVESEKKITVHEGIALIMVYILFVVVMFNMQFMGTISLNAPL